MNDRIDIITNFAKLLSEADMHTAYSYTNETLGLTESVDDLVSETQAHINFFSY